MQTASPLTCGIGRLKLQSAAECQPTNPSECPKGMRQTEPPSPLLQNPLSRLVAGLPNLAPRMDKPTQGNNDDPNLPTVPCPPVIGMNANSQQADQRSVGSSSSLSWTSADWVPRNKPFCRRFRASFAAALLLATRLGFVEEVRAADPFDAFLDNHCIRCHGPEKEKGDLRIDRLSRDFKLGADTHHWAEMMEQVNSGEMPPKKEKRPTQEEIAVFVTGLDSRIKEGRAARMAARPAVAHYRLSRKEYQNTVYDLLGVRYDPAKPGELNEDTLWHGFERIGSELSLSPSHVDRYYRAAELVLDRAFPTVSGEVRKARKDAAELRYGGGKEQRAVLERFGIQRPLRYLLFPGQVQTALSPNGLGKTGPEHSGLYKVRIQASGIRPPEGQPAHLSIGKRTGEETVAGLVEFDLTAPEDSPQIYEFELFLEMPVTLDFCVVATDVVDRRQGAAFRNALTSPGYMFTHSSQTLLLNANAPQMFDDRGNGLFSTVLLDWIEWEGPLVSEEERSRSVGLVPPNDATPEVVAGHLQRFAERAWRRPVKNEELVEFLKSYRAEREAGEKTVDAYRVAMQGVMTSRHFIYHSTSTICVNEI